MSFVTERICSTMNEIPNCFLGDHPTVRLGRSLIVHADCLDWLGQIPENTIHGIVTDPPYGVKEYEIDQLEKRAAGAGGVWRIPPSFDGHIRAPFAAVHGVGRLGA